MIGAPLTGVILIFELTMNYEFAIAAMLSTVTCIVFTNLFFVTHSLIGNFWTEASIFLEDVAILR